MTMSTWNNLRRWCGDPLLQHNAHPEIVILYLGRSEKMWMLEPSYPFRVLMINYFDEHDSWACRRENANRWNADTLYRLIWIQYCRKYQIIPKRNQRKPVTYGPSSSMDVTRSIQIKLFKKQLWANDVAYREYDVVVVLIIFHVTAPNRVLQLVT